MDPFTYEFVYSRENLGEIILKKSDPYGPDILATLDHKGPGNLIHSGHCLWQPQQTLRSLRELIVAFQGF